MKMENKCFLMDLFFFTYYSVCLVGLFTMLVPWIWQLKGISSYENQSGLSIFYDTCLIISFQCTHCIEQCAKIKINRSEWNLILAHLKHIRNVISNKTFVDLNKKRNYLLYLGINFGLYKFMVDHWGILKSYKQIINPLEVNRFYY